MSLPSEYVIEDVVGGADDVIVYRANHPIHDTVCVYLPDDALPPPAATTAKRRLYQNGLQMRNLSMLDVPLVTKALEVSQNPNEPYIVTQHTKHDLEECISNGVTTKPKRMFAILSQVLEAIIDLAAAGWVVDRIHPRQVKLPQLNTGDISFNVVEGTQYSDLNQEAARAPDDTGNAVATAAPPEKDKANEPQTPTVGITKKIEQISTPEGIGHGPILDQADHAEGTQEQLRTVQRNIYILGDVTYQLLFGRKYHSSDQVAAANIKKLPRRWRKTLSQALSQDLACRYETYDAMLVDVRKALNRNKRLAVASVPFLLVLAFIGSYFAYERYHRHQIMTSPASQVIERFLDIVNKTDDRLDELPRPELAGPAPNDHAILEPFDQIGSVDGNSGPD
ncbi:MAG: hypothetical protein ACYTEL_25265 [Planctomycetota bacterium]|jgi:hypothetical protein